MQEYDVLVVGAGLAGMRAALSAYRTGARVALISKVHPVRSHSNAAQGGINAALTDRGDRWEDHAYDTVKGSDWLGDQDAIEVMCKEAGQELINLEHMGVIFNRDEEGRLGTRAFGGQRRARTFFVADITGQAILHVMYEQILKAGITLFEEWFCTDLVVEDGRCAGCVALEIRTGRVACIPARAVVLATGGLGRVFEPSTNALICTGDGMALAYRAGAPLMDMEMVQYHPTTLKGSGVLITEGARGEGAYLLNKHGERFMARYAPKMMELASRDVVSRAEMTEILEGRGVDGCVLLDCRHLGARLIRERLSQIYEIGLDFAGVDITKEPIPIRPGMHYQMGGIKTDIWGRCWDPQGHWRGVEGLFAAGECACVSVHGGNRLGANSLLDTVVFGRRAGETAAQWAQEHPLPPINDAHWRNKTEGRLRDLLANESNGDSVARIRWEMGITMDRFLGVFRDREGMEQSLHTLRTLRERYQRISVRDKGRVFNTALVFALELDYMLECAEAIAVGALERKESRGAHYRRDYPNRDDANWLKHILLYQGEKEEGPTVAYLPVTITQWPPEKRVY
ncbi:MAG: FAD-dependent oxidoreductase [Dehalococcoidia bacterium]